MMCYLRVGTKIAIILVKEMNFSSIIFGTERSYYFNSSILLISFYINLMRISYVSVDRGSSLEMLNNMYLTFSGKLLH